MTMKNVLTLAAALAATAGILAGCNSGMGPQGLSEAEAKKAIEDLPPADRIKFIESSPMPDAEKKKKIAEIKAQAGIK